MKLKILILLIFLAGNMFSQPTGQDGGLLIENLYNNKLEAVDILSHSTIKIRTFALRGGTILRETFFVPNSFSRI